MDFIRNRSWMYKRTNPGRAGLTDEFINGVYEFIRHACTLSQYHDEQVIRCPCRKCKSGKSFVPDDVIIHLCRNGFKPQYWWWIDHGEVEPHDVDSIVAAYRSERERVVVTDNTENSRYHDMVRDAYNYESTGGDEQNFQHHGEEMPNEETQKFYDLLEAANRPLWEGSAHSELSVSV